MEPDGNLLTYLVLLVILVGINAFFTMSEISIISLNDSKLRKQAQDGNKKAQLLVRMIGEPSRFLAMIQVGVTFSGFLSAAVAAEGFASRLALVMRSMRLSPSLLRILSVFIITLLLACLNLVFGALVPKRVGMQHFERIAFGVAKPLSVVDGLTRPVVWILSTATNAVLRLLGINPHQKPEQVTEEEIRMMIDVGNESGSIESAEKDMLNNIFEFDDRIAIEMMTHRTEIVAVESDTPLEEIVSIALSSGYSRIPVYENDLDSIIGILYVKDLLGRVLKSPEEPFDLSGYMRDALYVPESASGKSLLSEFQQKKIQMAIVVDEYGGTSGLVTMEDLLESIVGNIQDEYDDEEEEIRAIGENLYEIDALAGFDEVAKFLSLELSGEDEDFETIGGYIVHRLGHIPAEGTHPDVQIDNVRFTVVSMDERRILKLHAQVMDTGHEAAREQAGD